MGYEVPVTTWNDQPDVLYFGPMAYMVEYDPVTFEAEDAAALFGASIEGTAPGYSGTGYVRLNPTGVGGIVWVANIGMGSPCGYGVNMGGNPVVGRELLYRVQSEGFVTELPRVPLAGVHHLEPPGFFG